VAVLVRPDTVTGGTTMARQGRRPGIDCQIHLFPGYTDARARPCVLTIDKINGKRYKPPCFHDAGAWRLFKLTAGIGEQTNLISQNPEIAASPSKITM